LAFERLPNFCLISGVAWLSGSHRLASLSDSLHGSAVTLIGASAKLEKDKNKPDAMTANVDGMKAVSIVYERNAADPDINKVYVTGF
jgi:hypothetical protein